MSKALLKYTMIAQNGDRIKMYELICINAMEDIIKSSSDIEIDESDRHVDGSLTDNSIIRIVLKYSRDAMVDEIDINGRYSRAFDHLGNKYEDIKLVYLSTLEYSLFAQHLV